MHLNECFALGFGQREEHRPPSTDESPFGDLSFDFPGYTPHHGDAKGGVAAVLRCIGSDWFGRNKTVFYIPKANLAGYTFLFGESDLKKRHSLSARGHRSTPRFVNAGHPNNLHPHNYTTFSNGSSAPSIALSSASFLTDSRMNTAPPKDHRPSLPMTTPYFHPDTDIPVPPLVLPWYFGLLCFSFMMGGFMMLYFPPKWIETGGKDGKRHWYWKGYFVLGWLLLSLQGPSSFMADYVRMTDESIWHNIDRVMACFLFSLECTKLVVMCPHTRPMIYASYLACFSIAVFCFMGSQAAQVSMDPDGFIWWHNGWHCYPILATSTRLVEMYLESCGERCRPSKEDVDECVPPVTLCKPRKKVALSITTPVRRSRRIAGRRPEY